MIQKSWMFGVAAFIGLFAVFPAQAQDYPAKTLTIVIGYAPGGGVDVPARYFAAKLTKLAGVPVIVENRPGALTNIAAAAVARSAPDGYTLFIASGNATMASNPHLFKKLPFDPVKDFTPVTTLFKIPFFVIVSSNSSVKSVSELTAYLKEKGDTGNYGYAGTFTLAASELYKTMAGLRTVAITYKVPQQSMAALISGQLDFLIQDATNVIRQVQAGRMRALAVTSRQRSSLLPDVPTMQEAGFAGFDMLGWFGLYLPANAPAPVVEKLAGWFNQIVAEEETRKFLANVGSEPFPGSARSVAELQARELERWGRYLKAARVEPQ